MPILLFSALNLAPTPMCFLGKGEIGGNWKENISPAALDGGIRILCRTATPDVVRHLEPEDDHDCQDDQEDSPDDEDALADLIGPLSERVNPMVSIEVAVFLGVKI